jgi:folate-binding protein YgfZ
MSQTYPTADAMVSETPLAAQLTAATELKMHRGARTPLGFGESGAEVGSLLRSAGIFDLGYRTLLRVAGKDRVRWLNGMITNTVKDMTPGQVAYTLVLNPQGRIQGDADVSCYEEFLLLETDRFQSERLLAHLRRFIIMDQVTLEELDGSTTALGIAGPRAAAVLEGTGIPAPEPGTLRTGQLARVPLTVFGSYAPVVPRYEIHVPSEEVLAVWKKLAEAGAAPCGVEAVEMLRVVEGVPAFDVDFGDKHLPQETNLQRALNFTKGCYIGQETVERIRARATLHRTLRQFELEGRAPGAGEKTELRSGDAAAGELTSAAVIRLPGFEKTLALGVARVEAVQRAENGEEPLRYEGGTARPLAGPPAIPNF